MFSFFIRLGSPLSFDGPAVEWFEGSPVQETRSTLSFAVEGVGAQCERVNERAFRGTCRRDQHCVSISVVCGEEGSFSAHCLLLREDITRRTEKVPLCERGTSVVVGTLTLFIVIALPWHCPVALPAPLPWNSVGEHIGHRGFGSNKNKLGVAENTMLAFQTAYAKGIRCVEFDVQLTKEEVPVLFHDVDIPILYHGGTPKLTDSVSSILKDVSVEQLAKLEPRPPGLGPRLKRSSSERRLKTSFVPSVPAIHFLVHEPYPSLQKLLEELPADMGFNVEVKYAEWRREESYFIDRNAYVDRILDCIFRHVGTRRIVFSSFDPDICYILAEKQRIFPVLYLTEAGTAVTEDVRKNSLAAAFEWARMHRLAGIASDVQGIFGETEDRRDLVQQFMQQGFCVFTYGSLNNDPKYFKLQKELGFHGIISDKWRTSK